MRRVILLILASAGCYLGARQDCEEDNHKRDAALAPLLMACANMSGTDSAASQRCFTIALLAEITRDDCYYSQDWVYIWAP